MCHLFCWLSFDTYYERKKYYTILQHVTCIKKYIYILYIQLCTYIHTFAPGQIRLHTLHCYYCSGCSYLIIQQYVIRCVFLVHNDSVQVRFWFTSRKQNLLSMRSRRDVKRCPNEKKWVEIRCSASGSNLLSKIEHHPVEQ